MRKPPQDVDESLWGKSQGLAVPYPLARHLLDAAAMAMVLWDRYLSENQRRCIAAGLGLEGDSEHARAVVGLSAGLHDIGKISGFQLVDQAGRGGLSDALLTDLGSIGVERLGHDVAGMEALPAILSSLGFEDDGQTRGVVARLAQVVGGHHGCFCRLDPVRAGNPAYQDLLGGASWASQRLAHARSVFDVVGRPEAPGEFSASAAVLVTGVVILADWLVSQEDFIAERQRRLPGSLADHFAASLRAVVPLLADTGLEPVELERRGFAEAYGITGRPNALQRSVMEELPAAVVQGGGAGILLVTAAPGDGKTEAALEAERVLSAIGGTRGFAFLLPTMATSDQMHGRVARSLVRQGGDRAGLTLTHSMAWLSSAYADESLEEGARILVCDEGAGPAGAPSPESVSRPKKWLRGAKRPLLAQFAVGTVDQALMSVLPVRHNALRLLALSGKTFVVDEAHAYDPYMQVLLGRLLHWLGAFGVPVVLLSATLPISVSDRLIKQYLEGAGHRRTKLKGRSFRAPYPGWLFVDAAGGTESRISEERQRDQADERSMELRVQVESVTHRGADGGSGRLDVLERVLEPMLGSGEGCALVVCNTVGEAQETYTWLSARLAEHGFAAEDIQLLHARFPGDVREERTERVTSGMGRGGPRPLRRIIVATQVVEQSLDLDADVVISDLAPLALLLQRAGRCWRHETWWAEHGRPGGRARPGWAEKTGPRLVVLDPLARTGRVPDEWGAVYPEFLLLETSRLLEERDSATVSVPGDVQELVEAVHGDRGDGRFDWNSPQRSAAFTAYAGENLAQESVGHSLVVPGCRGVVGLEDFHHLQGAEDEWVAATRLGADSIRLLCVYEQESGQSTLDPDGRNPLPGPDARGRMAVSAVRAVMRRTIPVRADWLKDAADEMAPPEEWAEHPMLSDLAVLRQPVRGGRADSVRVGRWNLRLDECLGLVRE
ncbi:CRISPR-associated helicase Cas3' [Streptomyces sp. TRM49041]|uniref:CRISPR-associated helicase Cas3' n=1 Tax=Streptomyces sp. TRM49041 TaxID=2603216 RepID=UPI0011EC10BA|nr:CRISPR-associated helicase Cas3' [Streptomyces sp. TRM49041]